MRYLVVALLGIALIVGVGGSAQSPSKSVAAVPQFGRYQIFFSPYGRADTFLVDTDNGRIWVHAEFSGLQGKPIIWEPEVRLDTTQEMQDWAAKQKFISAEAPK